MTVYTRVYSPNGAKAHLAAPGTRVPLCPARGRPPKDGWRGGRDASETAWADALETCQHCQKLAAARDAEAAHATRPEPAAVESPAGPVQPEDRADLVDAGPAGTTPTVQPAEILEPLPGAPADHRALASLVQAPGDSADKQAATGVGFLARWKSALSANRAGQRGDRGRRNRTGRSGEYGPGQNRRSGS